MQFAPSYRRFALPAFAGAAVAAVVFPPLKAILLVVSAFVLWFSRGPERSSPDGPGVVAPAGGHVSVIRAEDGRVRVGVFMSIIDVHVSRAPVSGSVQAVTHHPGTHKPASSRDSSRNERVDVGLDTDAGDHEVPLITDVFVQRIHSCVAPGDEPVHGQKLGHIDFGSQADMLLPPEFGSEGVVIGKGESVRADETVLARRERTSPSASAVSPTLLFCSTVNLGSTSQPIGGRYINQ